MENSKKIQIASRCHDIQISLNQKVVPEFSLLPKIGMLVRLSLHLRGLPQIKYEVANLVAYHYLSIPPYVFDELLYILADLEFVTLDKTGDTIHSLLPDIPYFDDVYMEIGEYSATKRFNENELLSIAILDKLTESPQHRGSLFDIGAEHKAINRTLQVGNECGYLTETRARGKDIVYSPLFFTENADIYTDLVAKSSAKHVQRVLDLLKQHQGWPLPLIQKEQEISGNKLSNEEIELLLRLAQDGTVKPPAISTSHHGLTSFLFPPTPIYTKMHPGKKDIYERAMALIAAVRQGQLLPKQYAIRNPYAILRSLKEAKYLRANTEANEQYKILVPMRIGYLDSKGNGWHVFRLHDTTENNEALELAMQLLQDGSITGMEVNEEAKIALQKDQSFIEGIVASSKLREQQKVQLSPEIQMQIDDLLLGGIKE